MQLQRGKTTLVCTWIVFCKGDTDASLGYPDLVFFFFVGAGKGLGTGTRDYTDAMSSMLCHAPQTVYGPWFGPVACTVIFIMYLVSIRFQFQLLQLLFKGCYT